MIFIWANKYFIWINEFKNKYSFNVIQWVNTSLRISWKSRRSQLSYLKVTDLDQYILKGDWYTQVNDRFQEYKTF